jgi:hypothetical protein
MRPDPEDRTYEWAEKLNSHIQTYYKELITAYLPWLLIPFRKILRMHFR